MLERFWIEEERENHFFSCIFISFIFTALAITVTHFFVPFKISGQNLSGIISVLLASLGASYPLIRYLERRETEEEEIKKAEELKLLERHWNELEIYLAFFIGATLSFAISNYYLPGNFFSTQEAVIGSITGNIVNQGLFMDIITNNVSVFFLTFMLSFLLTAGIVFILVWNASVLGVFLSNISKNITSLPIVALSYLPHGILEIAAYIFAGISGFFFSHEFKDFLEWEDKEKALKLMEDSMFLLVIGLIFLVLAGLLESVAI
jgi:uncharacterized membrane protein SpoIIM required for sporulation